MFQTLEAAYAAANEGDTILLAGSSIPYGSIGVHKRLHFVGPGYVLDENGIPGLGKNPAVVYGIHLYNNPLIGSASGTILEGVSVNNFNVNSGLSGIIVRKSNISQTTFDSPVVIRGSIAAYVKFNAAGSVITNSIILGDLTLSVPNTSASHVVVGSSLESVPGTSVTNSVFASPYPESIGPNFANRARGSVTYSLALGGSYLPAGNGNLNGQLPANVFVNTGSEDAKWRLKTGSPAIGAGFNGVDIGPFGGATPYKLSGVPAIPRLTHLVVPATATSESGLRFEVEAQAFGE